MKRTKTVLSLLAALTFLLSGCVVVRYTKETVVRKDGDGKIIEIIETERITEPHSEPERIDSAGHIKFEYLK